MEKLTPEQEKKLLEWAGIVLIPHTDRYSSGTYPWIEYQKNGVRIYVVDIYDLNWLFREVVPKLSYHNYTLESIRLYPHFGGKELCLAELTLKQVDDRYSPEYKEFLAKGTDIRVALVNAIWEVIK